MKDRLREAVFNLVGTDIKGAHAIDLFAGTGALGLEALSRGARRRRLSSSISPRRRLSSKISPPWRLSTRPKSCRAIRLSGFAANSRRLRKRGQAHFAQSTLRAVSAKCACPLFRTVGCILLPALRFLHRADGGNAWNFGRNDCRCSAKSVFVVEADDRFDFRLLPQPDSWDVRVYPPAVVGVMRKAGKANDEG